eukprot:scaffold309962_cov32-Prasinocladus_malaysianus.AAC.4
MGSAAKLVACDGTRSGRWMWQRPSLRAAHRCPDMRTYQTAGYYELAPNISSLQANADRLSLSSVGRRRDSGHPCSAACLTTERIIALYISV